MIPYNISEPARNYPPGPPGGSSPVPRVYAILVVNNGSEWLQGVLDTLESQHYANLDVVVVDNGSGDDSKHIIADRVPEERTIRFRRNVGFGRAVSGALKRGDLSATDYVLLLHDDLVLAPTTLTRLVEACSQDPSLGIVGPKLREWTQEPILQEVGRTIDRFGRAESPVEPGELDQGQHDRQRDVLFVSTAGMLIRADVLEALGGFDTRYPAFRDDLDFCWRAWLQGYRVQVVPAAVGYHIGAATRRLRRLGLGRVPRELAERHTVATMMACYEPLKLLWLMPTVLLFAIFKIIGFIATRRLGDAFAVIRAYTWNLVQFPATLGRRRRVQRSRKVSDAQIARLLAPGLPRAATYTEAFADWVAGGSTRAFLEEADEVELSQQQSTSFVRTFRDHPAAWVGGVLAMIYIAGIVPLLGPGQLVGGDILPWPASPLDFIRSYASAWSGEPYGSAALASPVQAMLGLASFAGMGSAWLAQRLIVLGLVPLAWLTALRAGRIVTARPGPRALGATLYVLSPVVMGALSQGLLSILAVAAFLPALVVLAARLVAPTELWSGKTDIVSPADPVATSAWRSAALLAISLAAGVALAPRLWPLFVLFFAAVVVIGIRRRQGLLRIAFVGGASVAMLAPWLAGLAREGRPLFGAGENVSIPLWRSLTVVPEVLPSLTDSGAIVVAATTLAAFIPALLLGRHSRPKLVLGLVAVFVVSGLTTWGISRIGFDGVWTPGLLLPAALAHAGLGMVAACWIPAVLRDPAGGIRQIVVTGAVALLSVGLVVGAVRLGDGPYDGLTRNTDLLPPFVTADSERVGPYRILLLQDQGGEIRYDVVGASGASMLQFGTVPSERMLSAIESAVAGAVGGADPTAATRLGSLDIRYVVVGGENPNQLIGLLDRQAALQPAPLGTGRTYRVTTWLPRVAVLPPAAGETLLAEGVITEFGEIGELSLVRPRPDLYRLQEVSPEGGLLVLNEAPSSRWVARLGVQQLERRVAPDGTPGAQLPVNMFVVPAGSGALTVEASSPGQLLVLISQVFIFLAIVSLALRPPGAGARGPLRLRRWGGRQRKTVSTRALPPTLGTQRQAAREVAPAPVPERTP